MILEKNWEGNKDKLALFIDLEKAFDSVKWGHFVDSNEGGSL